MIISLSFYAEFFGSDRRIAKLLATEVTAPVALYTNS